MDNTELHNIGLIDLHSRFITRLEQEGKSSSSISSIKAHAHYFLCFLERQELYHFKYVTQSVVDQFFSELHTTKNKRKEGGLSPSYINKFRDAVLRLIEFYEDADLGASSIYIPTLRIEKSITHVLSRKQMHELFEMNDNSMSGLTNKAILSVLYGLGLRAGELHNLNISDIDLHKGVVHVAKTKNRYSRIVPMTESVKAHIENYIFNARNFLVPTHEQQAAFLVSKLGRRMSIEAVRKRLNSLKEKSSAVNLTPHLLRHSIATHLLRDLSLEEIATFLGHTNIDSTQVYTHVYYDQSI